MLDTSNLYEQLIQSQFSQIKNHIKEDAKRFEYIPFGDGIELTAYNGEEAELKIPESIDGKLVRRLANKLFANTTYLKKVYLPETVLEIGKEAFYQSSLTNIILPSGIRLIEEKAFLSSSLTEIVFPKSLKVISDEICKYCDKLHTVIILGAQTISKEAFFRCYGLEKLVLSEGLKRIDSYAFAYTYSLCKIIIPSSVVKIENDFVKVDKVVQVKHIAFLNDNIECDSRFACLAWGSFDKRYIFYCNAGSTMYKFAREIGVETKRLSQFSM